MNTYDILDVSFSSDLLNLRNEENSQIYLNLVKKCDLKEAELDVEFEKLEQEYRGHRRVANYLNINKDNIHVKYKRQYTELRAIKSHLLSADKGFFYDIGYKKA